MECKQEIFEKMQNDLIVAASRIGKRIENGKCAYCGMELKKGEYCNCNGAKRINRYYKKANQKICDYLNSCVTLTAKIPQRFEGMTFEDYKTNAPQAEQKQAILNGVKKYYSNVAENYLRGNNLMLIGKWGTGKTMLMSILCTAINECGFGCVLINIVDLMTQLKASFSGTPKKQFYDYISLCKAPNFLFLDDLDKEPPTDFVIETIYSIINYRTEHELPTIISANSTLDVLNEMYGEAIISRFAQNANVLVFTQDNERLK